MEQWMHHRKLPPELMQCVRRYHQYRWVATQGVNEESLLQDLPIDLRRDIKRHICLDLVQKVFVILNFSVTKLQKEYTLKIVKI